ncbi:hypothetical protein KTAU_00400 [Thermogemmatispora aurantia]|uniref:Uncharacterized protein n=1 Tax=Thermogemmatispora aurantia TaxID=2045279 RepID=A0A5J4K3Q0_9CHLR|nr:hypothetical protein KTAU_00400 [Thermogemmatispora aurantia]
MDPAQRPGDTAVRPTLSTLAIVDVNDPWLKPGACRQPRRPELLGWLIAAHCPAGQ